MLSPQHPIAALLNKSWLLRLNNLNKMIVWASCSSFWFVFEWVLKPYFAPCPAVQSVQSDSYLIAQDLNPARHMGSGFLWGGSSGAANRELKPNISTKEHHTQTISFYYQLQGLLIYQTRPKWCNKYINKYCNRHTSHEKHEKHDIVFLLY